MASRRSSVVAFPCSLARELACAARYPGHQHVSLPDGLRGAVHEPGLGLPPRRREALPGGRLQRPDVQLFPALPPGIQLRLGSPPIGRCDRPIVFGPERLAKPLGPTLPVDHPGPDGDRRHNRDPDKNPCPPRHQLSPFSCWAPTGGGVGLPRIIRIPPGRPRQPPNISGYRRRPRGGPATCSFQVVP